MQAVCNCTCCLYTIGHRGACKQYFSRECVYAIVLATWQEITRTILYVIFWGATVIGGLPRNHWSNNLRNPALKTSAIKPRTDGVFQKVFCRVVCLEGGQDPRGQKTRRCLNIGGVFRGSCRALTLKNVFNILGVGGMPTTLGVNFLGGGGWIPWRNKANKFAGNFCQWIRWEIDGQFPMTCQTQPKSALQNLGTNNCNSLFSSSFKRPCSENQGFCKKWSF